MHAPSVAGEKQVVIGALVFLMAKPRVFVGRCSQNRTPFSPMALTSVQSHGFVVGSDLPVVS